MKRYYYTDPLAAAWMVNKFRMGFDQFRLIHPDDMQCGIGCVRIARMVYQQAEECMEMAKVLKSTLYPGLEALAQKYIVRQKILKKWFMQRERRS